MDPFIGVMLAIAGLCGGMLISCEIGRRIGLRKLSSDPDGLAKGTGAAEAAVFGLLGLLIAFTFSGAASRFEARRHLITAEANAISTAYLRIDLAPSDSQPELRALFRQYATVRAETYQDASDLSATQARLDKAEALQRAIWDNVMAVSRRPDTSAQVTMLLVPALNEMIDIMTTRIMATRNHPPLVIFILLGGLSLIGSLLVGYGAAGSADRNWFHSLIFALILPFTVYVIVDLEFPRRGLVQVGSVDSILLELPEP